MAADEETLTKLVQNLVRTSHSTSESVNAELLLAIYMELTALKAELKRHPIKRLLGLK